MDYRVWDKDLELRVKRGEAQASPKVNPVEWVKALVKRQGIETAYRVCRRYAVPFFIFKKANTENPEKGFYQTALGYLKKNYPIQAKHGRG